MNVVLNLPMITYIPSLLISITQLIQGEKPLENPMNQQNDSKNEQTTKEKELTTINN